MSTPYEREFTYVANDDGDIAALGYPGRCVIDRISVVFIGGGDIAVDVYSRQFVGPEIPIFIITSNGDQEGPSTYLQTNSPVAYKVGDLVTVTGSSVDDYNTNHRIVQVIDDFNYITDQDYIGDAQGGDVQLNIPEEEWELYRVMAQITGTNNAFTIAASGFKNQDALPNRNIGVNRKIYLKFGTAGTYRISIRSHEGIAP